MKVRSLGILWMVVGIALLSGCGGSYSGVQAVVPGPVQDLAHTTPGSGEYTLYRASGFNEVGRPSKIERLWTISLSEGQRIGFKWVHDADREYQPYVGADLQAFAGPEMRDLGPYHSRDVQYLWAGSQADLGGYYQSVATQNLMKKVTMQ